MNPDDAENLMSNERSTDLIARLYDEANFAHATLRDLLRKAADELSKGRAELTKERVREIAVKYSKAADDYDNNTYDIVEAAIHAALREAAEGWE